MTGRRGIPFLLCALMAAPAAHAGLFDDAEARQQVIDLKTRVEQQFDTQAKGQLELATQIQALKDEISRLRGQIETLTYENEQNKKRQQDLYLDLDSRLRKLEPAHATTEPATSGTEHGSAAPQASSGDTAAESKAYEAALTLFKEGKYSEAGTALEAFVKNHPDSALAPNAQFWLGNAWFAQKDCKKAIDSQLVVVNRWPNANKAPDALLAIANCQKSWGNTQAAKRTLETLLEKYPDSQVAPQARQKLGKK